MFQSKNMFLTFIRFIINYSFYLSITLYLFQKIQNCFLSQKENIKLKSNSYNFELLNN